MRNIFFVLAILLSYFPLLGQTSPDWFDISMVGKTSHVLKYNPVNRTRNQDSALNHIQNRIEISYFDGLGRVVQEVRFKASPSLSDLIKGVAYDGYGRISREDLLYAKPGNNGKFSPAGFSELKNFYSPMASVVNGVTATDYPFKQDVFDNSGHSSPVESGAPGRVWQPGEGHTRRRSFGSNSENEVSKWQLDSDIQASLQGFYPAGMLYKTTLYDENWSKSKGKEGTVEEFKDFEDHVILKRIWETGTKKLDTYYLYDDFGDLRYVIPPGYTAIVITENNVVFNELLYAYHYDNRRRLIEKKVPGKGWEWLIYNKSDRAVLTQDANQRARKEWTYIRYDAFGRLTTTGLYINTNAAQLTRSQMESYVNTQTGPLWETRIAAAYPSPSTTFPIAGTGITIKPLTINYYDDYSFTDAGTLPIQSIIRSQKTKSLQTGTLVYKDDGTLPLLSVVYYDDYGQVIQSASKNHMGGTDYITNTYNFVGELLTSKRVHTPATGSVTTILTTSSYDHVGRLVDTRKKFNTQNEILQSRLSYNEIGQLKGKSIHSENGGGTFLSSIAYAYNERGWSTKATSAHFSYVLNYNQNSSGTAVLSNAQYNGNIAQQLWGHSATTPNTYNYMYDGLNRLKSGISTGTVMSEVITYDDMGNIRTLTRDNGTAISYGYHNTNKSNRLLNLTGGLTGTFTYDLNGNATKDRTGMLFTYNQLNLPKTSLGADRSISYQYDAMGTKLKKQATVGGIVTEQDYIGGIEYSKVGSAASTIERIATEEGFVLNSGGTYSYHYNLTDHLGNVRSVIKREGSATVPSIVQRQDYYPFGKTKSIATSVNNKYLYNGKEMQSDLSLGSHNLGSSYVLEGQLDYGARFYDAEIGRWNVIDRFASKYSNISPYSYAGLDPIKNIDINGDSIWITSSEPIRKGNDIIQNHTINITGKVLKAGMSYTTSDQLASALTTRLNSQKGSTSAVNSLGGSSIDNYSISAKFEGIDNMFSVKSGDHLVVMVDRVLGEADPDLGGGPAIGTAKIGGLVSYVEIGTFSSMTATAFHEIGHSLGLDHPEFNSVKDPMSYTGQNANFSGSQLREITGNKVNIGPNKSFIINKTPHMRNFSTDKMPYIGPRSYMMRIPYPTQN